jgi:hypothetical protein
MSIRPINYSHAYINQHSMLLRQPPQSLTQRHQADRSPHFTVKSQDPRDYIFTTSVKAMAEANLSTSQAFREPHASDSQAGQAANSPPDAFAKVPRANMIDVKWLLVSRRIVTSVSGGKRSGRRRHPGPQ